jgi:hypothetical protein
MHMKQKRSSPMGVTKKTMTFQEEKHKRLISDWIKHALACDQMKRDKFDSVDVEELLGSSAPPVAEQVPLALALYSELVEQYLPHADKLIAQLVFNLDYIEELRIHTFDELTGGKVRLRQPPEFYLAERRPVDEQFVVEEYKRSFPQGAVRPSTGVVYSYYHSLRDDDFYTRTFVFQHYLKDRVEEIGR